MRYRVVMNDNSEMFFDADGIAKVDVDIHPEDENIWRVMDVDENVVFVGQGVRYVCEAGKEAREGLD